MMRNLLILTIVTFALCCCDSRARLAKSKVEGLLAYLNSHEVDSTILNQAFFYPRFSDSNNRDIYVYSLMQMKALTDSSRSWKINRISGDIAGPLAEDEYVFNAVFETEKRDSIFFRVSDKGISSFLVLKGGDRIKGWM